MNRTSSPLGRPPPGCPCPFGFLSVNVFVFLNPSPSRNRQNCRRLPPLVVTANLKVRRTKIDIYKNMTSSGLTCHVFKAAAKFTQRWRPIMTCLKKSIVAAGPGRPTVI